MEIIFRSTPEQSNFNYCAELFKNKPVLNGFNKLTEELMCENIADDDFDVQNVLFEKEIIADLFLCYPFKVVVKEEIKFDSLHKLISEIRRVYREIYHKENKTKTKIVKNNAKCANRGVSDGDFGIWGHDIYDLVIESIKIVNGDDKPLVDVSIGS